MVLTTEQILAMSNEYDIKIFLLCVLFLYSVVAIYFSYKIDSRSVFMQVIKYLVLRIPPCVFLFFMPLYSVFLYSAVSPEVVLLPLFSFYGLCFTLFLICWIMYGTEFALSIFGIKWESPRDFELNKHM